MPFLKTIRLGHVGNGCHCGACHSSFDMRDRKTELRCRPRAQVLVAQEGFPQGKDN